MYELIMTIFVITVIGLLLQLLSNYFKWKNIASLNEGLGISRKTCYIDNHGYLRWKGNNRLCHRDIAWNSGKRNDSETFGNCDVHHKDGNKFNNQPSNLEVLTRLVHEMEHGTIIYRNGVKYKKLGHINKIYRETSKAILMAHQWIPKSQCIFEDDYVYIPEWMYHQKFNNDVEY